MKSFQANSGCSLIDRFSLVERIVMRAGWLGFAAVGTYAIYQQAPFWAVFYVVYVLLTFVFIVMPGICAHCPYPSKYDTCLFLPPAFMNRFYPYKSPEIHPVAKAAVPVAMVGLVVIPHVWLFADWFLLLLFWLFGLPSLAALPFYYCKRCRNENCPLNKAGSGVGSQN
jgi:hypothetical protein